MSQIFFSYSRQDQQFVDALMRELEQCGHDVWLDRHDIGGGAAWRAEITRAVQECAAFVVVLSPRSAGSSNVAKEVALASEHGRPIFPVLIEGSTVPPALEYHLAGLQIIDFSQVRFAEGVDRLMAVLPPPGRMLTPRRKRTAKRLVVAGAGVTTVALLLIGVVGRQSPPSTLPSAVVVDTTLALPQPETDKESALIDDEPSRPLEEAYRQGPPLVAFQAGRFRLGVPQGWQHQNLSGEYSEAHAFQDLSGMYLVQCEVGEVLTALSEEAVLLAYQANWSANGMVFSEARRQRLGNGGLLVTGTVSGLLGGEAHARLVIENYRGVGSVMFYSADSRTDPSEREALFEAMYNSYVVER